jgi:hypothetical protein
VTAQSLHKATYDGPKWTKTLGKGPCMIVHVLGTGAYVCKHEYICIQQFDRYKIRESVINRVESMVIV